VDRQDFGCSVRDLRIISGKVSEQRGKGPLLGGKGMAFDSPFPAGQDNKMRLCVSRRSWSKIFILTILSTIGKGEHL
jgi:hypothetical protein